MIKFVIVPQHMAPKGWTCEACKLKFKPGQLALEIKTKYDKTAIHKHCAQNLLDGEPEVKDTLAQKKLQEQQKLEEEFDRIRQSYATYSV